MTTIADVRASMAAAITAHTGLRTLDYLSTSIPHPVAIIQPGPYDPRMVLAKSTRTMDFKVLVFVGPTSSRSAQKRCDELREPTGSDSVLTAIEDDTLWTATVDYAVVVLVGEVSEVVVAEETLMMFELDVEVCY